MIRPVALIDAYITNIITKASEIYSKLLKRVVFPRNRFIAWFSKWVDKILIFFKFLNC